jgi:hypothetical protein
MMPGSFGEEAGSKLANVLRRCVFINIAGVTVVFSIYFLSGSGMETGLWNWGYLSATVVVFISSTMATQDLLPATRSRVARLLVMMAGGVLSTGLFVLASMLLVINLHELLGGGL